jgi:AraC-like DNA-binding protein
VLDNYKLIVLAGGFARCDRTWTKASTGIEQCYKLYVPTSGSACIGTDIGNVPLVPGQIYFISGFRLKTQSCPNRMDVHWLHFMPESLYLRYLLDQTPPVQHWPCKEDSWVPDGCGELARMFPPYNGRMQPPREDTHPATACRIQGLLLITIARLLRALDASTLDSFHPQYYQLKSAVDYMQSHYQQNPSLRDIAARVNLAPNYFHRQFTALFGITPFNFMMKQRLNNARHLLSSTSLTIKEISEAVGYENPLYFSRVFTTHLGMAPSQYRSSNSER